MKRIFYLLAAASLLTVGCAKEIGIEPEDVDSSLIPLNIDGSISQVHTKATAAGFVDKDALGLFAVNYSEGNTVAGTLAASGNQADNVKYVFDESAYKWTPVKPVYYKDVNTNVDIYLYYPYQKSITDVNEAGFEVQKDQSSDATETELSGYEASDFLWGIGENVAPTEAKVAVSLTHRMSAVNVILAEKDGFEEGEFEALEKSIILTGTTRKAAIDYATGEVTPLGAAQLDGIVMCPQEDGAFRAVVVPQTVEAGVQLFAITIAGVTYSFRQSGAATDYQSGKQLDVTINITKKVQTGDYELELGDLQINPWKEDRNTHGGEARQYYVVNVETPGTLQATIEAAGKNPAKIRNLKVVGKVNDEDIFYMRDEMTILEAINMKESIIVPSGKTKEMAGVYDYDFDNKLLKYGDPDRFEGVNYWIFNTDNQFPERAFFGKAKLSNFVFPENVSYIGKEAFRGTSLSGALLCPDEVVLIDDYAFAETNIGSVTLSKKLRSIGKSSFQDCRSLQGNLNLPESLLYIGPWAFYNVGGFSGYLNLPMIKYLGGHAFHDAGHFVGDLVIPSSLAKIYSYTFTGSNFSGSLIFEGVVELLDDDPYSGQTGWYGSNFGGCLFTGELIIPEGCAIIPNHCFGGNNFETILLPGSLRRIGEGSFSYNRSLMNVLFNEGLVVIGESAFHGCSNLLRIDLPSTLQTLGSNSFNNCFYLSGITCLATEPPTVFSGAFYGVAKDNFAVEVPEQSIIRYQTEQGWLDFRRIAAHHDFSLSGSVMSTLNDESSRTFTLRAPSGFDWSIDSKPDWVTISPTSGTGKTDVTVTVSAMARTNEPFEVNEGSFTYPTYIKYNGRSGEVVFALDGKDYTTTLDVEQYDSDYADGYVKTYQTASKGNGIDIVFIGDGYNAKDIAKGTFFSNAAKGYEHFFDVEPYKSYKDYFNVYAVVSLSDDSGIGSLNTVKNSKFGSYFTQNRIQPPKADDCFAWAKKADESLDLSKSLVIMLMNTSYYEGVTMMYGDGSAIACCPVSTDAYPYDFRGIIQHEAGGHGFGKLGDEYIYHNAFIQNCACPDNCDHPKSEFDIISTYGKMKSLGWYKNLSMLGDNTQVPWAHLIYNPQYSDYVDMYEGGYMHSRGMYRSEATSCMNNNIPYYSAISRQAIVERIMEYAGEEFTLEKFYANDNRTVGPTTKSSYEVDYTFGVDPKFSRGSEQGSVVYMGEHPNVK